MSDFGQRPEDVVTDTRGNVQPGITLTFYATEADAAAQTSQLGSATTDADGRWTFTNAATLIYVRTPAGDIYPCAAEVGASTTAPDASTTTKGIVQLAGDLAGTAASPTVPSRIKGLDGKTYKVVACALRNGGSPNYWQPINSAGHAPIAGTVTTSTSTITMNYGFAAANVGSLVVTPDESLAVKHIEAGASVGTSSSVITLSRSLLADYVSYNGTSWSSLNGVFSSISMDGSGNLNLTHEYIGGASGSATLRDGPLVAQLGTVGATSTQVVFRDYAGTKLTTPTTDMRVFVTRVGSGALDPQQIGLGANENLWVYGVMEL